MAHHFQHLTPRGGDFPYIDRVNVYKYRNEFDYKRWQEGSTLALCNVPFDVDFSNIVDWGTAAARDEALSELIYYTSEPLPSNFRIDKQDTIKVPIPFDVADGANYIIVRNGQAATVGAVDYENSGGVRDLFFFILDCEQLAPNTTRLSVKLDVWTTYFDRLDIAAGYVERGHAPMWHAATPETYLADPLANCEHLTSADVQVSSQGEIVAWNRPTLLDTSEHFYCFAVDYDMRLLSEFTPARQFQPVQITAPTYSGNYAETVGGYAWQLGAHTTTNTTQATTTREAIARPPHALAINSRENAGAYVYGVPSAQGHEFFEWLFIAYPHIGQNIHAVFLTPNKVIDKVEEFTLGGYKLTRLQPKQVRVGIQLTREQFNYPPKYADLTKLYTSPYAKIVLTDLFGSETEVNIQDTTSRLAINLACTLLSGCTLRAELAGVGGATGTYRWEVVNESSREETILEPQAGKFFMEKQLPVFRITMSAGQKYDLAHSKQLGVERAAAVLAYENGQRSAGTALTNTLNANVTAYENGQRSASTALTNTQASAANAYTNTSKAADNARANDLTNIAASRSMVALENATAQADRNIEVDFMGENNQQQREKATFQFNVNRQNRRANLAQSVEYQAQSLQNQQAAQAANTKLQAGAGLVSSIVGGAMSGGLAGAAAGAVSGVFNGGVSLAGLAIDQNAASAESTLSIHKETEMAEIETETDRAKINNAAGAHDIGGLATDYSMNTQIEKQYDLSVRNIDRKLANTINAKNAGLEINATTADTISRRNTALSKEIAAADRANTLANATRENTTQLANLAAQKATGDANAQRSYQASTANAQAALTLAGQRAQAGYEQAELGANVAITQQQGSGFIYDLRREGFSFELRTPNKDAIAQLGDFFLLYGYAGGRVYDMSRLSLYSHYTYWQANDIMMKQVTNSHIMARVKAMFAAGVTVWRKMEDIGTMCLYDNTKLA